MCKSCKDDVFHEMLSECSDGGCGDPWTNLFSCIFTKCPEDGDENACPECSANFAMCLFGGDGCYTDWLWMTENLLYEGRFDSSTFDWSASSWEYPPSDYGADCTLADLNAVIASYTDWATMSDEAKSQVYLEFLFTCVYAEIRGYCDDTSSSSSSSSSVNADGCSVAFWQMVNCFFVDCTNIAITTFMPPTESPTTDNPTTAPTTSYPTTEHGKAPGKPNAAAPPLNIFLHYYYYYCMFAVLSLFFLL
jgi:hypothetical protein